MLSDLMSAFWKCLYNDLRGKGTTTDKVPYQIRKLAYPNRVAWEREQLSEDAALYLEHTDFTQWAEFCGLDPNYLKEKLNASCRNS